MLYLIIKRSIQVLSVFILFTLVPTAICMANAVELPSILIIVPDPPQDLEIVIVNITQDPNAPTVNPLNLQAKKIDKVMESYFVFYFEPVMPQGPVILRITTGDTTFEITVDDALLNTWSGNIFTLDLEKRTLAEGELLSRSIILATSRIVITLIIEGIVFFLFGFRKLRSWLIFLAVNLVTQTLLNIWINVHFDPLDSFVAYRVIFWEVLIIIIELITFIGFVKEKDEWKRGILRAGLYVIVANILSFIVGGFLITLLPI